MSPVDAHGMKFMSMGLMAPGDKPLIWRGPMAHKAFSKHCWEWIGESLIICS